MAVELEEVRRLVTGRSELQKRLITEQERVESHTKRLKELEQSLPRIEQEHTSGREAHETTRRRLESEIEALVARTPRLFGKADHERKVAAAREELSSHATLLPKLEAERDRKSSEIRTEVAQVTAQLASSRTLVESLGSQAQEIDGTLDRLQGTLYVEVFRPTLGELIERGTDNRLEYFELSTKIDGILESLPELGATHETADRCRIVYGWITATSFQNWYRGNFEALCKMYWGASRQFLDAETEDWLFEVATAFGAMKNYEYWMRMTAEMEEEFQFNVRKHCVHNEDLQKAENKLIRVLKCCGQESTGKVAESYLDILNQIRQLD